MKTLPLFLAIPALALGSAQQALGQVESVTGSHIPVPKRAEISDQSATEESGRILLREYARCTVAISPGRVAEALMLAPGDDVKPLARLASTDCLANGLMRFSTSLFRGGLMAEMFRRSVTPSKRPWTYPRSALPEIGKIPANASKELQLDLYMLDLSDCLYKVTPDAVRDVVVQPEGSERQKAAFHAIIAQLGPCVPSGQSLTINRQALENAFGEYLYRSGAA